MPRYVYKGSIKIYVFTICVSIKSFFLSPYVFRRSIFFFVEKVQQRLIKSFFILIKSLHEKTVCINFFKKDLFAMKSVRGFKIIGLLALYVMFHLFWTFSKLFYNCLGSVWGLFLVLKSLLFVVFSALNVFKMTPKIEKFFTNLLILVIVIGHFWQIWCLKKSSFGFFGIIWQLFQHCFVS